MNLTLLMRKKSRNKGGRLEKFQPLFIDKKVIIKNKEIEKEKRKEKKK